MTVRGSTPTHTTAEVFQILINYTVQQWTSILLAAYGAALLVASRKYRGESVEG